MSPTELLAALKMDPKNRSNATLLGFYLRKNNFQRGTGRERRNYQVTLKDVTTCDNVRNVARLLYIGGLTT